MKRKRQSGLTLLEVSIAAVILGIVVLVTFLLLHSTLDRESDSAITQDLEERGRKFTASWMNILSIARVYSIASDGSWIQIQVPVTVDTSATANNGKILWGWTSNIDIDPNNPSGTPDPTKAGWSAALIFQPVEAFQEQSGPTPTLTLTGGTFHDTTGSYDFNKDGQTNSTFIRGHILLKTFNSVVMSSSTQQTSTEADNWAILGYVGSSTWNGRIDPRASPGMNEPLFQVLNSTGTSVGSFSGGNANGKQVLVTLWHGAYDRYHQGFFMRRVAATSSFRNNQGIPGNSAN